MNVRFTLLDMWLTSKYICDLGFDLNFGSDTRNLQLSNRVNISDDLSDEDLLDFLVLEKLKE